MRISNNQNFYWAILSQFKKFSGVHFIPKIFAHKWVIFHPNFKIKIPTVLYVKKDSELLKNTSVGALAQKQRPFYWCWSVAVGNRVKTVTNSILFVLREETITQESITQSLTTIKYLFWPWMFYSGWIFILLRPEELSSSLLAR